MNGFERWFNGIPKILKVILALFGIGIVARIFKYIETKDEESENTLESSSTEKDDSLIDNGSLINDESLISDETDKKDEE